MVSTINFGSRSFKAIKQDNGLSQQNQVEQYFNFEISFNTTTGAGQATTLINLLNPLTFPFPVGLKTVNLYGNYLDTANNLLKTSQPYTQLSIFTVGGTSNINTVAPSYTLGVNCAISVGITVSGILGSNINYDSINPLYIPAQTPLTFEGFARYTALTSGTDALLLIARLLFVKY